MSIVERGVNKAFIIDISPTAAITGRRNMRRPRNHCIICQYWHDDRTTVNHFHILISLRRRNEHSKAFSLLREMINSRRESSFALHAGFQ